ncbi:MAG TPA: endonuclease III domain-containing protein [Clostridia bacterium]|nr:endonuclease III domain-containing protein [Clostridia bacterium]
MTAYDLLLGHFGPQNWWPAETPFEVALGAILTQQVSWRNVEQAINNLKRLGLLDPQKIRSLPLETLEDLIRPTGFYKTKAKKVKAFVDFLCERYDGSMDTMFKTPPEDLRKALLSVYGIGPETADSILLYAGGVPVFVVDAYTLRLLERFDLQGNDLTYERVQSLFQAALPRDATLFNEFHALIVALCKNICRLSDPKCKICPVVRICSYGRRVSYRGGESETGDTASLPKGSSDTKSLPKRRLSKRRRRANAARMAPCEGAM